MITCKIYSAAFKYTVLLTVITTVCITSPELHYMQGTFRAKKIGVLKKSGACSSADEESACNAGDQKQFTYFNFRPDTCLICISSTSLTL